MPDPTRTRRQRQLTAAWILLTMIAAAPATKASGSEFAGSAVRPAGAAPAPMPASAPIAVVTGDVRAIHGHARRRGSHVSYVDYELVTRRGRTLTLDLRALRRPPRPGSRVRVTGRLHDGVLRARRLTTTGRRIRARAASASGTYKTLILPFTFAAAPSTPWSTETLRSRFFSAADSLHAYLQETSHSAVGTAGLVAAAGDVTPWQTISAATTTCTWQSWRDAARASAISAGWNVAGYDRVIYLMPDVAACPWSGLAPYPFGGWAMLNGTTLSGVAAHELGHTFGLDHAASRSCTDGGAPTWISATCTTDEYGDPFDTMGDAWTGHWYHAFSRQRLGWLSSAQAPQISLSGTYDLAPSNDVGPGLRALSIPRGDGYSYHLEARTATGVFDAFAPGDAVIGGVSVRLVPTAVGGDPLPELLDTTPQTATFEDAALSPGRSVTDTARQITINTITAGVAGAQVRLWIGEDPGLTPPEPPPAPDPDPDLPIDLEPPAPDPAISGDPIDETVPTPAGDSADPTPAADAGVIKIRLARAVSRRSAVRNGLRFAIDTGRDCPCKIVVELRDRARRLVGRTSATVQRRNSTATVRLTPASRRVLARAARTTTLTARVRVLSPDAPNSARMRVRLR